MKKMVESIDPKAPKDPFGMETHGIWELLVRFTSYVTRFTLHVTRFTCYVLCFYILRFCAFTLLCLYGFTFLRFCVCTFVRVYVVTCLRVYLFTLVRCYCDYVFTLLLVLLCLHFAFFFSILLEKEF